MADDRLAYLRSARARTRAAGFASEFCFLRQEAGTARSPGTYSQKAGVLT